MELSNSTLAQVAAAVVVVRLPGVAAMGHGSERAMIYQHEARGADKAMTDAVDALTGG
jgi:hypothetical protein